MIVANKSELLSALNSAAAQLRETGVNKLAVFGSFARDQAGKDSDVDFYVEFLPEKKTFKNFMRLGDLLESITGRKVELVTPQSLNKFTAQYILKELEYVALAA